MILQEIIAHGVKREDITLLNGLGTHRLQTRQELIKMLGENIVSNYRCLQHDAYDQSQLVQIESPGLQRPVMVNRQLFEADLIILTGFIEPHFFAGYSGGPKAILPALAGAETVFHNHNPAMVTHPNATFNKTLGNPLWEEIKAAAECIENTFLVNVTLDRNNRITGVFTGDVIAAHQSGCQFVRETSLFNISEPYDLVITSNSGYPLDQNLYQCVKGMAAAKRRSQGRVHTHAGGCEEAAGPVCFCQVAKQAGSPQGLQELISQPEFFGQDSGRFKFKPKFRHMPTFSSTAMDWMSLSSKPANFFNAKTRTIQSLS